MLLKSVVVLAHLFMLGKAAERGEECIDQFGQKATCTSIRSCRISFNNPSVGNKAQISVNICGYDIQPLVCCQTAPSVTDKSVLTTPLTNNFTPALVIESTTTSSYDANTIKRDNPERSIFTSPSRPQDKTNNNDNSLESNKLPELLLLPSKISTTTPLPVETTTSIKNVPAKLYTSQPLVQELTKIFESNNNTLSGNSIESNNLPEALPLQSNTTTTAPQPAYTSRIFVPTAITTAPVFSKPFEGNATIRDVWLTSYDVNTNKEDNSEIEISTSLQGSQEFSDNSNLPDVPALQSTITATVPQPKLTFLFETTTTTTAPNFLATSNINKEDNGFFDNDVPLQSKITTTDSQPKITFPTFETRTTTAAPEYPLLPSKSAETDSSIKTFPPNKINKLLPDRYTCGFQNPRQRAKDAPIATIDEFPWTVLLKYRYGYGHTYDYFAGTRCLGTLISNRYVITAAQCIVDDRGLYYVEGVRLGEWLISSEKDCVYHEDECADKVVETGIEKQMPHPNYDPSCGLNNIGLLRLDTDIGYSDFIRPICLPVVNLPEPSLDTILTTSGWGVTRYGYELDIKSKIKIPALSHDECVHAFANFRKIWENQLCVGTTTSSTICLTDSGGALMAISQEGKPQWYLEGVIPEGFNCNRRHGPGIYTRVTGYVEWILNTISNDTF